MRLIGVRAALVAGAIGLAVAVGAVGIVAPQRPGAAYAQDFDTEFEGVVEAIPPEFFGVWQIGGRPVLVTELTEIDAEGHDLAPGLKVEVKGFGQEAGPVLATKIEAEGGHDGGPAVQPDDDDDGPSAPAVPAVPSVPGAPGRARPADDDD